jgi:hypothetical protein
MNLRLIGGKEGQKRYPPIRDKEEENPALESEEENEFGFPYRFTDNYIDNVEHIYNLINDNGDYEQARELLQSQNIGTIFVEDMRRLQHDLDNGMDLDAEEEQFIKDLTDMMKGIRDELRNHFSKRKRGGAIPERVSDTLTNDEGLVRQQIRFMTRIVDYITQLVDEPQTEEVESRIRQLSRKLNDALDYFDKHFSHVATHRFLNDEGLMEDYNNIVSQAVEANNFLNLDYGSSERKTT